MKLIDGVKLIEDLRRYKHEVISVDGLEGIISLMPSAEQQEKVMYSTMPDEDFEEWLRTHGICHPDIHEPIPCSVVPLLIDDAINELPSAQPEQQWIPVSERLPEESGTYICTCYDGTINRVTFIKYQKTYARWDLSGARSYWRVKAWMPLPIPYKDEKEI